MKIRYALLYSLFFLGLCLPVARGQGTLSGRLLDADTGEPILAAHVELRHADGEIIRTMTDFDGGLEVRLRPGSWELTTAYPGYTPLVKSNILIQAGTVTKLGDLALQSDVTSLETVVLACALGRAAEPETVRQSDPQEALNCGVNLPEVVVVGEVPDYRENSTYCPTGARTEVRVKPPWSDEETDTEGIPAVLVYPNPTRDQVYVQLHGRSGSLLVFTSDGRLVRERIIAAEEEVISLSDLPAGTYFLYHREEDKSEYLETLVRIR